EAVQADAVELLAARASRLVVSDQVKAEREDAIVGRVIERELGPEARRRSAIPTWTRAATRSRAPSLNGRWSWRRKSRRAGSAPLTSAEKFTPWSEKRLAGRSRIAPRLRPPTVRTGLAVPATMITDVPGVRVGHATDPVGLTGVTVVLCDRAATCGVELRGGANDVVGLDYLGPRHLVATVNGVVLGGGSRFGEEAIYGVMRWLEERGVGFATGPTVVPHVPGAFLFDLSVGDGRARPTREMGYEAAARAVASPMAEGSVGAGAGASVGKIHGIARAMRGGVGSASV